MPPINYNLKNKKMYTVLRFFKNRCLWDYFIYQVLMLRRILITSLEHPRLCTISARIIDESAIVAQP